MLVAALAERGFGRLADTLAPDVRMRALIPSAPVELSGAGPAASRFAFWFGNQTDSSSFILAATRSAIECMSSTGSG
jgi:hypothetical protein